MSPAEAAEIMRFASWIKSNQGSFFMGRKPGTVHRTIKENLIQDNAANDRDKKTEKHWAHYVQRVKGCILSSTFWDERQLEQGRRSNCNLRTDRNQALRHRGNRAVSVDLQRLQRMQSLGSD
ncbi:unnamed protein product [Pleuronectes platessa]|uniref:Uncharacterized protein n=1 Tax=Pleuronectes platessa TaxID=8262 RepID=A0A9N7VGD1_PLEPL|nr:unnamed protein product [Pleuronectes platessa]